MVPSGGCCGEDRLWRPGLRELSWSRWVMMGLDLGGGGGEEEVGGFGIGFKLVTPECF